MPFFHIFLTISGILGVSAIPFPVNSNDRSISYGPVRHGRPTNVDALARPIQDPRVSFQRYSGVAMNDRENSRAEVLKDFHLFSAESPASARKTKLAHVPEDWVYLQNCQGLKIRYCRGMRAETCTVDGGDRTIYRNIPPEKPLSLSFNRKIPAHENRELAGHITEYHNALPPNSPYRRAELTRVERGWVPGDRNTDEIRDHARFTSHNSEEYTDKNMIGHPHIIRRPLTLSFSNNVDPGSRDLIEKKVREHHASMGLMDKAKPSNVAHVEEGWYKNAEGTTEVQAEYYKYPDCPRSQDRSYVNYGQHPIALN